MTWTVARRFRWGGLRRWLAGVAMLLGPWALAGPPSHAATPVAFKVALIQFDPWARHAGEGAGHAHEGVVVDLLDEFERRSGFKTQRTLTPYARVEKELEEGLIDFSLMAWGPARARYAQRGVCFVPLVFGVRALKGRTLQSYEDLLPLRVVTARGLKVDPRFDADAALRKTLVLDYTTAVRMAGLGRDVDAVAGSLSTLNYLIGKLGMEERFGPVLVLNTTHLAVAFSKKSPQQALESEVNAVFRTMLKDGTARAIYDKWLGATSRQLKGELQPPACD